MKIVFYKDYCRVYSSDSAAAFGRVVVIIEKSEKSKAREIKMPKLSLSPDGFNKFRPPQLVVEVALV